ALLKQTAQSLVVQFPTQQASVAPAGGRMGLPTGPGASEDAQEAAREVVAECINRVRAYRSRHRQFLIDVLPDELFETHLEVNFPESIAPHAARTAARDLI